ncbi:hypothetical protein [Neoroseomonas soli]|uniref:Uncharacterized protein n=1 Tax=Neoroseomonas soli TaxID=1081025 RepID=A0A9X9WZN6_9PROT|nr:hypothetical protein [Neoroseomonas soli]MBR0672615.1 hypothetical protein [Neoroseomonas soli]
MLNILAQWWYFSGLAISTALMWAAALAWFGLGASQGLPRDAFGMVAWVMGWFCFAPLPYVFTWFLLSSLDARRAALSVILIGTLSGLVTVAIVVALFAAGPSIGLFFGLGCAAGYGVVMAALQDNVPKGQEKSWRVAHGCGGGLAMSIYGIALVGAYATFDPSVRTEGILGRLALPLGILAAGFGIHAAWCWRLMASSVRADVLRSRSLSAMAGSALVALTVLVLRSWPSDPP